MTLKFLKIFLGLLCLIIPAMGFADSPYIGTMSVLDVLISLVFGLCRVAGVIFIFMSFVYFRRYRQNSHETPLSKVCWVLALGLMIFFFPLLAQYNTIYSTMEQASQQQETTT